MYRKISIFLFIIVILVSLSGCTNKIQNIETVQDLNSAETNNSIEESNEKTAMIDKEEVINKLCSDEFEGRLVGSLGNELAGEYLSDLFSKIRLISMFGEDYKHEYTQEVYKTYGLIAEDDYGEVKTINNIVGKIEGTSNNAVIISAHFDHIGIQDGRIIKGAIDNASGVAVLLDLAETLNNKYSIEKPEFDIIFCAFNGEENGLTGSRKFIEDIDGKYNSLININIDSVGYKDGRKVTFLDANTNTSLYEPMKTVIENNGLEVELDTDLKGTADSVVFDKVGIPAICIIDENVKEVIHTENDVPELIDYERLDKIVKSVYDFVSSYEFN
mgnify:FL=1